MSDPTATPALDLLAESLFGADVDDRSRLKVLDGLVEMKREMFGGIFDKLRGYAEREDPAGFAADVCGYRPTHQQDAALELLETNNRCIVVAGTNLGKSDIAGMWGLYRMFCVSQLPDPAEPDGGPQGGILLLPGPSHPTIADTVWQRILAHLAAADNPSKGIGSFPIISQFKRQPRLDRADWSLGPNWFFRSVAPEKTVEFQVAHATSGRHSSNLNSLIEECAGQRADVWNGMDGGLSGAGNKIGGFMNPDPGEPSGPAWQRISNGSYRVLHLSCMDHPNVVRRATIVPGGAVAHDAVDNAVRYQCADFGDSEPDPDRFDFRYALKGVTEVEQGPRMDGVPGMEHATIRTYRPTAIFVAQKLGQFPTGTGSCPFDARSWDRAVKLWESMPAPTRPPDRVGVDPALDGGDTAKSVEAWGPTIEELLTLHRETVLAGGDVMEIEPLYLGRPRSLGSGDGMRIARNVSEIHGGLPIVCDRGGEGRTVFEFMQSLFKMLVRGVYFGGTPDRLLPDEAVPFNKRVQMHLRLAEGIRRGLVALPPDENLRKQAMAQKKLWQGKQKKIGLRMLTAVELAPKKEIKAAAGGSPDELDAVLMAGERAGGGGWGLEVWT